MMNSQKTQRDVRRAVHMHLSAIRTEMVDLALGCNPRQAKEATLKLIHTAESTSRAVEGWMNNMPWDLLAGRCRHATENMRQLRMIFRRKRKRKISTRKNHNLKGNDHEQS